MHLITYLILEQITVMMFLQFNISREIFIMQYKVNEDGVCS